MTPDQASVWTSVYLSVSGIAFHAFFLWRGLVSEELRSRLFLLEMDLLAEAPGGLPPAAMRLARLLRNSRSHAADLTYCRLVAARILLANGTNLSGEFLRDIDALADPAWRERCERIFAEWEMAVTARMVVGSPLLWLRNLSGWSARGGAARLTDLGLLEATFAPGLRN